MRLFVAVAAIAIVLPAPAAVAGETPANPTPTAQTAKPKKICRIKRAATGSNRRDGRVCKTEEQWRAIDGAEVEMTAGATTRSQSSTATE